MKAYTDISQSKKLAEILPLESADMYYAGHQSIINPKEWEYGDTPKIRGKYISFDDKRIFYPCQSFAALLELLPYEIVLDEDESLILGIHKEDSQYYINYDNTYNGEIYFETLLYDDFVDACYEMILKLHELKIL